MFEAELRLLNISPDNQVISNVVLRGLSITEANLPEFLDDYFKKLPNETTSFFGTAEQLINAAFTLGNNPQFLYLSDNKNVSLTEMKGLCVFSIKKDFENSGKTIVYLLHASTISGGIDNEIILKESLNYIRKTINSVDQIRITKEQLESNIHKMLLEIFNFKWNAEEHFLYIECGKMGENIPNPYIISNLKHDFFFKVAHFLVLGKEADKEPVQTDCKLLFNYISVGKQFFWAPGNLLSTLSQLKIVELPDTLAKIKDYYEVDPKELPDTKIINSAVLEEINASLIKQKIQLPSVLHTGEEVIVIWFNCINSICIPCFL